MCRIFRRGNAIVVQVEENPMINRVNFEGNSEINDENLAKEVELRERTIFTRSRVQSDVQRIVALYRRSGLFSARVEPKIIRMPQNRVDLVFEIQEGASTTHRTHQLRRQRGLQRRSAAPAITTVGDAMVEVLLEHRQLRSRPPRVTTRSCCAATTSRTALRTSGSSPPTAELAPDGERFFITFAVEEGPHYSIGQVAVNTGSTPISIDPSLLNADDRNAERQPTTTPRKVDKTVENMTLEAGKVGYAFAKVEPDIERDPVNRTLSIIYNIQEGPRTYIERIDMRGNVAHAR